MKTMYTAIIVLILSLNSLSGMEQMENKEEKPISKLNHKIAEDKKVLDHLVTKFRYNGLGLFELIQQTNYEPALQAYEEYYNKYYNQPSGPIEAENFNVWAQAKIDEKLVQAFKDNDVQTVKKHLEQSTLSDSEIEFCFTQSSSLEIVKLLLSSKYKEGLKSYLSQRMEKAAQNGHHEMLVVLLKKYQFDQATLIFMKKALEHKRKKIILPLADVTSIEKSLEILEKYIKN